MSCSVIMPTWSDGEGGGEVHQALADALGKGDKPDDLLLFAAAGNTAQRHWGGRFHDGGDGWHEWAPGRTDNAITPWEGETPSVEMCWPPGAVYELSVRDVTANREAAGRRGRGTREPLLCGGAVRAGGGTRLLGEGPAGARDAREVSPDRSGRRIGGKHGLRQRPVSRRRGRERSPWARWTARAGGRTIARAARTARRNWPLSCHSRVCGGRGRSRGLPPRRRRPRALPPCCCRAIPRGRPCG